MPGLRMAWVYQSSVQLVVLTLPRVNYLHMGIFSLGLGLAMLRLLTTTTTLSFSVLWKRAFLRQCVNVNSLSGCSLREP